MVVADARPVAPPRPDPTEDLRVHRIAPADVPRLIREAAITNAQSVMGLWGWIADASGQTVR